MIYADIHCDVRRHLNAVAAERRRQDEKWGEQNHDDFPWAAVLGEEYGEACQEALRCHFSGKPPFDLYGELIQVAAVAVAWAECLYRNGRV